jgi:hypothetical protein
MRIQHLTTNNYMIYHHWQTKHYHSQLKIEGFLHQFLTIFPNFVLHKQKKSILYSVHLGVDLFVPENTPVFAPFDAIVHRFFLCVVFEKVHENIDSIRLFLVLEIMLANMIMDQQ